MTKSSKPRTLWAGAVLLLSLAISSQAGAVAMSIQPGQTFYTIGAAGATAELTVGFWISGVTGPSEVVASFDQIVAYNSAVLKYKSASVNSSVFLDSVFDSPPVTPSSNYLNGLPGTGSPVLPSALGSYMGTPYTAPPTGYYEGSIRFQGVSTATGGDLLNAQSGASKLLFSVVFDVVLDQCAWSSIVLLDDKSFTSYVGHEVLDLKDANNAIHYFTMPSTNSANIQVPLPGTLALLGLGLIGTARMRRVR
jgi:hypothetical protein